MIRLLLIALLLAGCRARDQGTPVRVGYSALTPLHAALGEILRETDIPSRHGLAVQPLVFERGRDQHEKSAEGLVDATFSCEVPAMVHLDRLPGLELAGSPGSLGDMALVVRSGSEVRSPSDLRGRTVALQAGASSGLALESWLGEGAVRVEEHGGRGEEVVRAVVGGRAEAGVLWDPWLSQALAAHDLRVVASSPFWSVVALYDDRLDDGAWDRYGEALEEALAWAAAHPDRTVELAARRSGLEPGVVGQVLGKNAFFSGQEPDLAMGAEVRERLEACEAWAVEHRDVSPGFRLEGRVRPEL